MNDSVFQYRWRMILALLAMGLVGCQPPSDRPELLPPAPEPKPVEQVKRLSPDTIQMLKQQGAWGHELTVADFWAPWEAGSSAQRSELAALADTLGPDVSLVGFSLPDPAQPPEKTGQAPDGTLMADASLQEAFGGIRAIPTRILVDAEGRVLARFSGFVSLDVLREEIEKRLTPDSP